MKLSNKSFLRIWTCVTTLQWRLPSMEWWMGWDTWENVIWRDWLLCYSNNSFPTTPSGNSLNSVESPSPHWRIPKSCWSWSRNRIWKKGNSQCWLTLLTWESSLHLTTPQTQIQEIRNQVWSDCFFFPLPFQFFVHKNRLTYELFFIPNSNNSWTGKWSLRWESISWTGSWSRLQ